MLTVAALRAGPSRRGDSIWVSTVKGIEVETCMRMDEVFREILDPVHHPRLCFLSGPSFARADPLRLKGPGGSLGPRVRLGMTKPQAVGPIYLATATCGLGTP